MNTYQLKQDWWSNSNYSISIIDIQLLAPSCLIDYMLILAKVTPKQCLGTILISK